MTEFREVQATSDRELLGPLPQFIDLEAGYGVREVKSPTGDLLWLVSDYELAKQVLRDTRFSRAEAVKPDAPKVAHAAPSPESMTSMDGPEHARLRRMVAASFSQHGIVSMEPFVLGLTERLLDAMERRGGVVDVATEFATPLALGVLSELLGVPEADREQFTAWVDVLFDLTVADSADTRSKRLRLVAYMTRLIKAKRREPGEGLLSELIQARDNGEALTERELVHLGLTLLMAGYESTSGQIAMTVAELLREPDRFQALAANPDLAPVLAEEYLRVNPAASISFPRVATEDVQLGDVLVRKGEGLIVSLLEANRNPDAVQHLAFGYGVHLCLGRHLARMQLASALRGLARRFPTLRLAPGQAITWKSVEGARGLASLAVTW
ncbi:cytochrome P450 [Allokutzneria multivorans]|uniref:Cytochrome P450 n=1 Tax=Allokutzneria multivorans TaxID=1142134 RepID=A0ABP7QWX1_9PSEU